VSTFSFNLSNQSTACTDLLCHSKAKGLVTTQTTKDHNHFAISEIIGAAQVPVPHHNQHVINTISAQDIACFNSSLLSSAAFLPVSGFDHAHNHLVVDLQILIFVSALQVNKAWASVFIAINSTHSNHQEIILLIALHQPPHTQMTFIFAIGEI
jgi:hypothetical protein